MTVLLQLGLNLPMLPLSTWKLLAAAVAEEVLLLVALVVQGLEAEAVVEL